MKYETALGILKETYEKAKNLNYVRNPVSWALYQTWKTVDRSDRGLISDECCIQLKGVEITCASLEEYERFIGEIFDEAAKTFSKFLIDRAEGGSIEIQDLPDLTFAYINGERKNE